MTPNTDAAIFWSWIDIQSGHDTKVHSGVYDGRESLRISQLNLP